MVESIVDELHWETVLVTEMALRTLLLAAWAVLAVLAVFVVFVLGRQAGGGRRGGSQRGSEVDADLAVELLFGELLNPVTGLMEASIAVITIDDFIPVLTPSIETYLAVGFEDLFEFLQASQLSLALALTTHVLDSGHFQGLLQHFLGLIAVSSLEVQQDLSHSQITTDGCHLGL